MIPGGMSEADEMAVPYQDFRLGEPAEFPAPPPEVMAELRRLLPPVPGERDLVDKPGRVA